MGLLDRMVSDMISKSTGVRSRTSRRMVRKIGGGKLLMMGGAVIAGALLQDKMKPQTSGTAASPPSPPGAPRKSTSGSTSVPPPPPGARSATIPPPPPGAPAATPQESVSDPDTEVTLPPATLYAVLRTMVAAALADGHLSSEEKKAIEVHLSEDTDELDPEQLAQVRRDLVVPATLDELTELVPAEDRDLALRFAVLVLHADGSVSDHENAWLGRLAEALGATSERVAEIAREVRQTVAGDA